MAAGSVHSRLEKDYEIQCDDASDLVSVADFKRRCGELYHDVVGAHVSSEEDHVTFPPEIAAICNTDSLLPAGGLEQYMKGKKTQLKDTPLHCLNDGDAIKEYFERKGLSYHGYTEAGSSRGAAGTAVQGTTEGVGHGEIVLSVLVFHPIKKRRDAKVELLGRQGLTDLRDQIPCFRDYTVDQDYSDSPDDFDHRSLMKGVPPNRSPSAFFFINNTFYNDGRHPDSLNLSTPIIRWSRGTDLDQSSRLDHYSTADMAGTRLDQLSVRLGYPFLYCHHTNCQHIVIFTDLRMLHPSESHRLSDYPIVVQVHAGKRKLCYVCNVFAAEWVTLEDELVPESPCFFCRDCFKKLHYTTDGRKVCQFKAYPYNPTVLV